MYKIIPLLLYASFCFMACELKVKIKPKAAPVADTKKEIKTPPDTAMVSLKSRHTMATTDLLCQDWTMDDADKEHWNLLFWDSAENKRKYPNLALFNDNKFTENVRSDIKTGSWKLDKITRGLLLKYDGGGSKSYHIRMISLPAIVVVWPKDDDSIFISFVSDNLVHKRSSEDPLYPSNNSWRIRPRTPENDIQLRERVKACVHFYALFFKDNVQRQETDISFIGLPSCFQWYNGGIGLTRELDKKWVHCFYSEEQAYRAYDILKDVFDHDELVWPDKKLNWVVRTQSVLEQIENKL